MAVTGDINRCRSVVIICGFAPDKLFSLVSLSCFCRTSDLLSAGWNPVFVRHHPDRSLLQNQGLCRCYITVNIYASACHFKGPQKGPIGIRQIGHCQCEIGCRQQRERDA